MVCFVNYCMDMASQRIVVRMLGACACHSVLSHNSGRNGCSRLSGDVRTQML